MIRQPISAALRFGLGLASVVFVLLLYTLLSSSRQAAARRELQRVAQSRLEELSSTRTDLSVQLSELEQLPDSENKSAEQKSARSGASKAG